MTKTMQYIKRKTCMQNNFYVFQRETGITNKTIALASISNIQIYNLE